MNNKRPQGARPLTTWLALFLIYATTNAQTWNGIDHKGEPWVKNVSRPYEPKQGLNRRHIALWSSHGRYYSIEEGKWKWQRPPLHCTTEDLYTQTIVVSFLIPMLENAGANVFTPRERDWQKNEVIVDNDNYHSLVAYREQSFRQQWRQAPLSGFANKKQILSDGENPFTFGTARVTEATKSNRRYSSVCYQPDIPEEGQYAVYVSYQTTPESVPDAHYDVWHKGQCTEFRVNQRMGGSTWVYLGTFEFDKGCNDLNKVVLTNQSAHKGVVTTDAVRFGGGMGNIERGGETSGMPRCLEGARYWAQWAGMPYHVYSSKLGQNDYADDINARSLMVNYLAAGSAFVPPTNVPTMPAAVNAAAAPQDVQGGFPDDGASVREGLNVPIELSLAVHSDAGHTPDGQGVYGSLAICTTNENNRLLPSGISRNASRSFAQRLLDNIELDISQKYGGWKIRNLYDRNYSETRVPQVPSAIIETLSHQNFGDMRFGQDPTFRFTLARAIYKAILRQTAYMHNEKYTVQPLAPTAFGMRQADKPNEVELTWLPTDDPDEPTAKPQAYIIYKAEGEKDFDNGTVIHSNHCKVSLTPGVLTYFKVAAINDGGSSFPTSVLAALYNPLAQKNILIVDAFDRTAAPAANSNGFLLDQDPGVSFHKTPGWLGRQVVFDNSKIGVEDSTGLGFSTDELQGMFIAGNDFNHVKTHAEDIAAAGIYNIMSCTANSLHDLDTRKYHLIDFVAGLQKNDTTAVTKYHTFTDDIKNSLREFIRMGGALLVSGSYIASDQVTDDDKTFLQATMKCSSGGTNIEAGNILNGLGMNIEYLHQINEQHYAATQPDIVLPIPPAYSIMAYDNKESAAVGYSGTDYRAATIGIPLECITHQDTRRTVMRGLLNYLLF